ncbi:MAG: DUF1501 domain-containing protein [Nocardiaceae bacterium]|nr:DUF1501 domain-containing protein [Nocardiaceae bacterium]
MALSRRNFLFKGCGAAASAGIVGTVAVNWDELLRAAQDAPAASKVLVIVTLYGGNDGINTVVPYTSDAYHDARPGLSYAPERVLPLDSQLALNPSMPGLAGLWKKRQLAIVRGVGYPNPDRSHFRSMDIWQTAQPSEPVSVGWIGRWLDLTGDDPIRAVNVGTVAPLLAFGRRTSAACLDLSMPALPVERKLAQFGKAQAADTEAQAFVRAAYRAGEQVTNVFGKLRANTPRDPMEVTLGHQLEAVAAAIKSGAPTQVYSVSLAGFDTHADELNQQEILLKNFDEAVTKFIKGTAGRDVTLMAYSEFGRRVRANASQGTDHGTAGPMFVVGSGVKGGFYGDEPSLTDLVDGDLKTTTDFRDVYAELLEVVVGTDPEPVVGKGRKQCGFLAR